MRRTLLAAFLAFLCCVTGNAQKSSQDQDKPAEGGDQITKKSANATAVTAGNLEVLSDTRGVNFGPYLEQVLKKVRANWYNLIPQQARAPQMESGKVAIEFVILPDGKVAGLKLAAPSIDVALDRAAWGGIKASNPFDPLPPEFHGPYLALRFRFYFNPKKDEVSP